MAIPLSYNLRNLTVRKGTTIMTALGIALTVAVLMAMLAMVNGLESSFATTGDPLNLIVTRKGSDSELVSNLARTVFQDMKLTPGIARNKQGEPMASLELISIINIPSVDQPEGINVTVRGLPPIGFEMRPELKLIAGRLYETGRREIVIGKAIAIRHPDVSIGKTLRFGRGEWTVVGVMDGGRSAYNSEIFCDLNQLSGDYNRNEVLSSAMLRATGEVTREALINRLEDDPKLNVSVRTEREYYASQMTAARPLQVLGSLIALIMAVGSSFAAMNTMYSAVARRAREIGTLRVLGFSQGSILLSFFIESLLLSVLGGLLGCLLVLPLNGVTTGLLSFKTFSQIAFDFTISPKVAAMGMAFAIFMGAFGGFFPARSAAKKEILSALRDI